MSDQSDVSTVRVITQNRACVYADQDPTLGGSQICTGTIYGIAATAQTTLNATLYSGWNLMQETVVLNSTKESGQATVNVEKTATMSVDGPRTTVSR